ncbi:MAG TPA: hypothetical protein VFA57_20370 [Pseudolabrys sp.]|jgi:hypothetical protein|nr:hypothetical protein [Pseudolabrys sp.]
MAYVTHRRAHHRRDGHNPLAAPLLAFAGAVIVAALYIAYVLWPRWPEAPVALNAPALPIVVSAVTFNIEPAAIREAIERKAGVQDRVDLSYLWPSLLPPDPAATPSVGSPINPNQRLFVTIAAGDSTLPLRQRVEEIYPRYLVAEPAAGPDGLTLRAFRAGTPYEGEELVFEQAQPEHFLARCSLKGVTNSGECLLERRIGNADVIFRFPRDWLKSWASVAAGIDKLIARLHPSSP